MSIGTKTLRTLLLAFSVAAVSLSVSACSETKPEEAAAEEKPTEAACEEACGRSVKLHYEYVIDGAKARGKGDPKAEKEHIAKAQAEWDQMLSSGREKKNIAVCTQACVKKGKKSEIECMRTAKSVMAVKACQK